MDGVNELQKKGTKTMANLPTTMEYFDNLLGEQLTDGGGSGGGGSSDFSTAEVTFINSTSGSRVYTVHIAQVYDGQNGGIAIGNLNVGKEEPITIKVPLYKNNYAIKLIEIENASSSVMPTTTGDITFSSQGFLIQSNGTITMSSN